MHIGKTASRNSRIHRRRAWKVELPSKWGTLHRHRVEPAPWLSVLAFIAALMGPAHAEDTNGDIFSVPAAADAHPLSLISAIGNTPKTVYVPGRFYKNGKGALFMDGKRFVTHSGASDVQGFISNGTTYLIAVKDNVTSFSEAAVAADSRAAAPIFTEEELKKLPPEMRLKALQLMDGSSAQKAKSAVNFGNGQPNAIVFYRCTFADHCEIARIVKGMPTLHIAENAIWFSNPTNTTRISQNVPGWLLTYSGIDAQGKRLDGPNGVLAAAPLSDGASLIKKLVRAISEIDYTWVIQNADGSNREVFSDTDNKQDTQMIEVPQSIVVNATPVSPSVQFGVVSVTSGGYESFTSSSRFYYKPVCVYTANKASMSGSVFFSGEGRSNIAYLASQLAVVPMNGKLVALGQANVSGNTSLGMLELDCKAGAPAQPRKFQVKALAKIYKEGFSFVNHLPQVAGLGGFVHVKYPGGNLFLLTERMKEGKPFPGIQLEDGKRIANADAQRFLEQYGIVND